MNALLAMGWAAVAVALLVPPGPGRRLAELDRAPKARSWGSRVFWVGTLGAFVVLAVGTLGGIQAGAWALLTAFVAATGARLGGAQLARSRRIRAARQVGLACEVVSAQLRSGALPARALALAAEGCPAVEPAMASLAIGGDAGRALVAAGRSPGLSGLCSLGRAWQLSEVTGAPMAALADQVSARLRADAATRELVAAELAAPRSSSRLLALLPVLGIGMGALAGGDPVHFLLGTPLGLACLVAGVGLVCLGLVWADHMAARAEGAS